MTKSNIAELPTPPSLPANRDEYLAKRVIKAKRTINDLVEEIHLQLADNPKYQRYLEAIYDPQAVEGSLTDDNVLAAEMIRDHAIQIKSEVKDEKLYSIRLAHSIVLRRYGESRKERRMSVSGERVATENGNE